MITRLDPDGMGNYPGTTTPWERSSGSASRHTYVDDGASASDADFLKIDGAEKISFTLTDLPGAAVDITQVETSFRNTRDGATAAGPYDFKGGVRSNGTDSLSNLNVTGLGTYATRSVLHATDPSGGGSWTVARVNSLEALGESLGLVPGEYLYLSYVKADVTHSLDGGGFACLVGSMVGAALGLSEMARLASYLRLSTRYMITPDEYRAAWIDIRSHRWPKTFQVAA